MQISRRYSYLVLGAALLLLIYNFGFAPAEKFFLVLYTCLSEFRLSISRNAEEVKIYIWTSRTKLEYQTINIGDTETLNKAGFNPSYPVKVMIHGFSDRAITSWTDRLRKDYFSTDDYNIFTVDWQKLAESPWYNTASKNTKLVGQKTAQFLTWLVEDHGVEWDNVHILGSSLGAQAAGYTGRFTGGLVGRITGLDPSGPLFHSVGPLDKLDKTDGQFVDVIHTAGYWVGNEDVMGHVDYFPNGGRAPQPGCETKESLDLSCSHFQAWKLFGESIEATRDKRLNNIIALECESYQRFLSGQCCGPGHQTAVMGDSADRTTRGTFYLQTRDKPRYALPYRNSTLCDKI